MAPVERFSQIRSSATLNELVLPQQAAPKLIPQTQFFVFISGKPVALKLAQGPDGVIFIARETSPGQFALYATTLKRGSNVPALVLQSKQQMQTLFDSGSILALQTAKQLGIDVKFPKRPADSVRVVTTTVGLNGGAASIVQTRALPGGDFIVGSSFRKNSETRPIVGYGLDFIKFFNPQSNFASNADGYLIVNRGAKDQGDLAFRGIAVSAVLLVPFKLASWETGSITGNFGGGFNLIYLTSTGNLALNPQLEGKLQLNQRVADKVGVFVNLSTNYNPGTGSAPLTLGFGFVFR
jgi:hypothetical protein